MAYSDPNSLAPPSGGLWLFELLHALYEGRPGVKRTAAGDKAIKDFLEFSKDYLTKHPPAALATNTGHSNYSVQLYDSAEVTIAPPAERANTGDMQPSDSLPITGVSRLTEDQAKGLVRKDVVLPNQDLTQRESSKRIDR